MNKAAVLAGGAGLVLAAGAYWLGLEQGKSSAAGGAGGSSAGAARSMAAGEAGSEGGARAGGSAGGGGSGSRGLALSPEIRAGRSVGEIVAEARALMMDSGFNQTRMLDAWLLLKQLEPSEIPEAMELLEDGENQISMMLQIGALARWSEADPSAAMRYATEELEGQQRWMALSATLGNWAQAKPLEALAWYREQTSKPPAESAFTAPHAESQALREIFRGLAAKDVDLAMSELGGISDSNNRSAALDGLVMSVMFAPDKRDALLQKIGDLPKEDERRSARSSLVRHWAQFDPKGAREFVETTEPEAVGGDDSRYQMVSSVYQSWTQSEPEKAAEWLIDQAGEDRKSQALRDAVNSMVWQDPNRAAEWLAQQDQGPEADDARQALARRIVDTDPESAFVWASTISEAEQRADAIGHVYRQWVGKDRQRAVDFLEASDLPAEKMEELLRQTPAPTEKPD